MLNTNSDNHLFTHVQLIQYESANKQANCQTSN